MAIGPLTLAHSWPIQQMIESGYFHYFFTGNFFCKKQGLIFHANCLNLHEMPSPVFRKKKKKKKKKERKKLNVVSQETMLQISLRSFKNDSNEMSSPLYWKKKSEKNNLNCYLPIFSGLFKA